ncbi:hypothetical protein EV182_000251 [Spiromyces aspiralis]|uniref:Uncharacterized protein n=1 Tax=Spiromyces aspiralis TaxID=68401 RepID=A0ACC1HH87_9FUNG|nr:hypothetical protein EV182_000251 [Spiromyces aspiralis]
MSSIQSSPPFDPSPSLTTASPPSSPAIFTLTVANLIPDEIKSFICEHYYRQTNTCALRSLALDHSWQSVTVKFLRHAYTLRDASYRDPVATISSDICATTRHLFVDFEFTDLHIYGGKPPDHDLFARAMTLPWPVLDSLTILPPRRRRRMSSHHDNIKTPSSATATTTTTTTTTTTNETSSNDIKAGGRSPLTLSAATHDFPDVIAMAIKDTAVTEGSSSATSSSSCMRRTSVESLVATTAATSLIQSSLASLLNTDHQSKLEATDFPDIAKRLAQIPTPVGRQLLYLYLGPIQNAHAKLIASSCPNLVGISTESLDMDDVQLDVNGLMALSNELKCLRSLSVHTRPPGAEMHYINRKFLRLFHDAQDSNTRRPSGGNNSGGSGCVSSKSRPVPTVLSRTLRSLAIKHWLLSQTSIHMLLTFFPSLTYLHINPAIFQRQTVNAELQPYPSLRVLQIESVNQKKLQAVIRLLSTFPSLRLCVFREVDLKPSAIQDLVEGFPNVMFDFDSTFLPTDCY